MGQSREGRKNHHPEPHPPAEQKTAGFFLFFLFFFVCLFFFKTLPANTSIQRPSELQGTGPTGSEPPCSSPAPAQGRWKQTSRQNIPLWPEITFKGGFLPFSRQEPVSRIHLESLLARQLWFGASCLSPAGLPIAPQGNEDHTSGLQTSILAWLEGAMPQADHSCGKKTTSQQTQRLSPLQVRAPA